MKVPLVVLAVIATSSGIAFRPAWFGKPWFWVTLLGAYGVLAGWALYRMWEEGILRDVFAIRRGDFSLGVISGLVLLGAGWVGQAVLTPTGSPEQAWLAFIYLLLGDPMELRRSIPMTLVLLSIAALEEIVWRAMVLDSLMQKLGSRRAWPLAALLYALALLPTAFTLQPAGLGPNPLLPLAALGCGLVWSFTARLVGRLPPLIISHMVFTYFTATQFRLPL
jgi:membrane protease YdiL (CAAX protease family)